MAPSRTLRSIAPILLVVLIATPILAQNPPRGWRPPPSYSEQKKKLPPPQSPAGSTEAASPKPEYPVPMRRADGTLCFGPDTYDDVTLKRIRVICEEPWIRVERTYDSTWEPEFGWYCWPREHFCSRRSEGCMCHRRDVFAAGWKRHSFGGYDDFLALRVAPEDRCSPYDRDDYPYPRDIESRIAERQGMWSLYTGHVFGSLKESDIEHVVALSEAHDSGLCEENWTVRRQFARDLDNLTLAQPLVNRYEKRAKDAAEWLPAMNRCWFAATVVMVKMKYDLTVDARERDALMAVFAQCE